MIGIALTSFRRFSFRVTAGGGLAVSLAIAASAPMAWAQQFRPPMDYPVGTDPQVVTAGDFNGDGIQDLAVGDTVGTDYTKGEIRILLGNGNGTFRAGQSLSSGGGEPNSIVVRDFNHDGHMDLAVANYGGSNSTGASLAILFGVGDGSFRAPVVYPTNQVRFGSALANGVAAGDFNGDGEFDLVVAENATGVTVYLGETGGRFRKAGTYKAGLTPTTVVARDLNRDGKLDLAVSDENGNEVEVLLGNGDGSFQPSRSFPAGPGPAGMKCRDLNGDGILDLVVANAGASLGTTVTVLLGVGDGTFREPVSYPAGYEPFDVAVADCNGDGKLDLAVADVDVSYPTATVVSVLLGNGDGTFGAATQYMAGAGPVSLVAAALNRDRCTDLAVANSNGNSVSVLLNAGGGKARCQSRTPVVSSVQGDGEDSSE